MHAPEKSEKVALFSSQTSPAAAAARTWGSVVITDAPTPKMWTWPIEATLRSLLTHAPAVLVNSVVIAFDGAETSSAPGAEQRGHYGGKCARAAATRSGAPAPDTPFASCSSLKTGRGCT